MVPVQLTKPGYASDLYIQITRWHSGTAYLRQRESSICAQIIAKDILSIRA